MSEDLTLDLLHRNNHNISKIKIQTHLNKNLTYILEEIDEILNYDLKS